MSVTINVNGLSLCHKGSGGVSMATIPDVCKTPMPGGPVPLPYPNIAFSRDLASGSTTVSADGGNSIAIKGSEFSRSTGDEPGSVGGVSSGTFIKEAKWILYSFDVAIDGANACRLTDPMTHNHGNTVNMAGELQPPVPVELAADVARICAAICACNASPGTGAAGQDLKQQCVSQRLQAEDDAVGNTSTVKPEINYNMTTRPPSPIMSRANPMRGTDYLPNRTGEIPGFSPGTGMVRRPDAVIVKNGLLPPTQSNLAAVVEIKFPPDPRDADQLMAYRRIAGPNPVLELSPQACGCPEPKKEPVREPVPVRKPSPLEITLLALALAALVLDDAIGGEADDILIPGILARLAAAF